MPDPLIARHSCPFVRHLIASRGSRGILRVVAIFVPSSLSLSAPIQFHGARLGVRYTRLSRPSMHFDTRPLYAGIPFAESHSHVWTARCYSASFPPLEFRDIRGAFFAECSFARRVASVSESRL